MITKYYVDELGAYLGAFVGIKPPAGAIEVPEPPAHGSEIWDGKQFQPAPPVVPERVPMLSAQLELLAAGWMPLIDAFIDQMQEPDRSMARVWLDKALTMARNHPLVLSIPEAIGKTESEVDALFIRAGARDD